MLLFHKLFLIPSVLLTRHLTTKGGKNKKNEKDLADIDKEVLANTNFVACSSIFEVLDVALSFDEELIAIMKPTNTVYSAKQCKEAGKNESKCK